VAILTVDEIRPFVDFPTGDAADAALQILLDAAEQAIVGRIGAAGAVTETVDGGWPTLILSRPIVSVTSITEDVDGDATLLDATDYRFAAGGYVLTRVSGRTHFRTDWHGRTRVVYASADDAADRQRVQIALVRLDLNHRPGLTAEAIGAWSQSYSGTTYQDEREDILATIGERVVMSVID
jgi:hypothetical protein